MVTSTTKNTNTTNTNTARSLGGDISRFKKADGSIDWAGFFAYSDGRSAAWEEDQNNNVNTTGGTGATASPLSLGEQYAQRAYDHYAKPYQQQFEELGKATKKEALAKGLYLSGDYGRALGDNLEDYSRKVAENVVVPLSREAMQMDLETQRLGLQERVQTEAERAAQVSEGFQEAEITGQYAVPIDYKDLGLNQLFNEDGTPNIDQFSQYADIADIIGERFAFRAGREATDQEMSAIFRGETVNVGGLTEQARAVREGEAETTAARIERARQFDASQRQQQQQFLTTMSGRVSGPMVMQNFGITEESIQGLYHRDGSVNFDIFLPLADTMSAAAESQGVYLTEDMINGLLRGEQVDVSGAPTLDRQRLADARDEFKLSLAQDLQLSDAERNERARQFNVSTMRRQIEYATDVTGKYGAGAIDAELLGIDLEAIYGTDEDGNIDFSASNINQEIVEQTADDLKGIATAAGLDLSDNDIGRILGGESITVSGAPTLAGRKMASEEAAALHQRRLDRAALDLEEDRQRLSEAITRAEQSGTYVDPVTNQNIDTLEKLRFELDERARMLELTGDADGRDADGNFISSLAATYQAKQIEWEDTRADLEAAIARASQSGTFVDPETGKTTETLQKQLQDANIRIQDANLGFEREKEYQRQREVFADLTGTFKPGEISMEMLGIDVSKVYNKEGAEYTVEDLIGVSMPYQSYVEQYGLIGASNRLIGEYGEQINAAFKRVEGRDLTEDEFNRLLQNGTVSRAADINWEYFFGMADAVSGNAIRMLGRDLTFAEQQAILRGETISLGDPVDTLAKMAQEAGYTGEYGDKATLDKVIQMAQLTGYLEDGDEQKATLAGNRQTFDQEIAKRVQALNEQTEAYRQNMEAVREKGYWEIGESGTVTAEELGIDTTYTSQLNSTDDVMNTYEATRLKEIYRELAGEELSDQDVYLMLKGQGKTVTSPIRIQTLAARSESNREQIERGNLLGTLGSTKTEAARQFDENLTLRKNLNEADVARINSDVIRADKQLESQITQWVSQTNLDIAQITGQFGVGNTISAQELGVTFEWDGTIDALYDGLDTHGPSLRDAYTSAFGTTPTDSQIFAFLRGESIETEATPTLQGRQLAQLISSQSLDRANDMHKFAEKHDLALDEFAEMQIQYDEKHSLLVEQTANQFNLDRSNFALARQDLEAKHTGKWQFSGTITAQDLGFNVDLYSAMDADDKDKYAKSLMRTYETLQGEELEGGVYRAYDLLEGNNPVSVEAAWTQDAREAAQRYGLDERSFLEATDQYNRSFEESNRRAWIQITGSGKDAEGKDVEPMGFQAWKKAQEELAVQSQRQDMIWQGFINDALNEQSMKAVYDVRAKRDALVADDITNRGEQVDAIIEDFFNQYGYEPMKQDISAILAGDLTEDQLKARIKTDKAEIYQGDGVIGVYGFGTGQEFEEEFARLANAAQGHSLTVVNAMSGWQAAGQIFGQVLNAGGQVGSAYAASSGSDPGLKQSVTHIGSSPSGLNIYEFEYKPGLGPAGRYRGVMSNEIPQDAVIPRAILGRYDAVNYSKIDVDFKRLR